MLFSYHPPTGYSISIHDTSMLLGGLLVVGFEWKLRTEDPHSHESQATIIYKEEKLDSFGIFALLD